MAITAPTGVAAMIAGGTTLHALFWLPFGVFVEDHPLGTSEAQQFVFNKHRLFSTIKLTKARRSLLQELELLVIDEVSMVRADTLDAIDVILKGVRGDMRPFGGVQVLFVGDSLSIATCSARPRVAGVERFRIQVSFFSMPKCLNKILRC